MGIEQKIDIDLFKVITRAIAESNDLEIMSGRLSQLLVGSLGIKGCSIFALNPATDELEIVGSFGLSLDFINKGPVLSGKSIARTLQGEPIVVADTRKSDLLQYPDETLREGIGAIVSLPVVLYGRVLGAVRLYHDQEWEPPQRDLDSLMVLCELVGLAMTFTRILYAFQMVKESVNEVHPVWLIQEE